VVAWDSCGTGLVIVGNVFWCQSRFLAEFENLGTLLQVIEVKEKSLGMD
jgi:hypothetical protein